MPYLDILKSIKEDKVSGASSLYERAIYMFYSFFEEVSPTSKQILLKKFTELSKNLIESQPTMAPMINLANEISIRLEKSKCLKDILEFMEKKKEEKERNMEKLEEFGISLLSERVSIMTHSFSSSVFDILKRANECGKNIKAFCTLSPPSFEGKIMAEELSKLKISVKLIEDHAAPFFVNQVDIILVGADAVLQRGFINKIGTLTIALSAKYFQIPLYVVCTLNKFLPPQLESLLEIKSEEKSPKYPILSEINLIRPIFDFTPWNLVEKVITEEGIKDIKDVKKILYSIPVSKLVKKL